MSKNTLLDFFRNAPFSEIDLDLERNENSDKSDSSMKKSQISDPDTAQRIDDTNAKTPRREDAEKI